MKGLNKDWQARPQVSKLLKHKWFQEGGEGTDEENANPQTIVTPNITGA